MLLADGAAAAGVERVSLRLLIVARQSGPRLHRDCGHAADAEVPSDHVAGGGESTIRCDCITEHRAHKDIVWDLIPDWRSLARERYLRVGIPGQHFVVDFYGLRRVERLR